MPIYQYECQSCNTNYEVRQSFHDDPLDQCRTPGCEGTPQRLISPVGIVFKGSGFYINDSKNNGRSNGNGKSDAKQNGNEKASKSSNETKTETKSSAKEAA